MEINWEQLWIDARKHSVLSKYRKDVGIERWDTGAEDYSDWIKKNGYKYYEYHFDMHTEITPRIKEIIKDYIVENAVNGVYRRESKMKSAVMWWKK